MKEEIFDDRVCGLGEGAPWPPARHQLFWFDILGLSLLSRTAAGPLTWHFDEAVSAAGWVDEDRLLIVSEWGLWCFDLRTGARDLITVLEADNKITRSNDGRADPSGGFWIGTMGYNAEPGAGATYRFHRGKMCKLLPKTTFPNAICFAPLGDTAYFADTPTRKVMHVPLDEDGWPKGEPELFIDLTPDDLNPDGAVVDPDGTLWGAARVAAYEPGGGFVTAIDLSANQITCPAFGGDDMRSLFVKSTAEGIEPCRVGDAPHRGKTFVIPDLAKCHAEPGVIL